MQKITIRSATPEDAAAILHIYSYYIENTAITMEYIVPTVEQFENRIRKTLENYPYLVAEQEGKILGYAYAGRFHERAAFYRSAEVSIYLDRMVHKNGLGRLLYEELESRLKTLGMLNIYASIAYVENEDEYLNHNSTQFHAHMGYEQVARFHLCAYKFNRWYDLIWMEKFIGEHVSDMQEN